MTTSQKMAIVSPPEGMMVYDLDAKQFSYCYSAGLLINCNWVNFGNAQIPNTGWVQDVNDVRNTNAGNIGIGTAFPDTKLHLVGRSSSKTDARVLARRQVPVDFQMVKSKLLRLLLLAGLFLASSIQLVAIKLIHFNPCGLSAKHP